MDQQLEGEKGHLDNELVTDILCNGWNGQLVHIIDLLQVSDIFPVASMKLVPFLREELFCCLKLVVLNHTKEKLDKDGEEYHLKLFFIHI